MKMKHLIIVSLILAILTVGAVSAEDDLDALAVDDAGDDAVETPVDEVNVAAGDADNPDADDFNVNVKDKVVYDENSVVVSFDWPDYVKEYNDTLVQKEYNNHIQIDVKPGSSLSFYKYAGETSNELKFEDDLYIFFEGVYNINVTYCYGQYGDEKLVLFSGTVNATESTDPQTFKDNDFITELYGGKMEDNYICTFMDPYSGLNGVVTIYANNAPVYTKKFDDNRMGGVSIWLGNLTGTFNGDYTIKVTYDRAADGKSYSRAVVMTFSNAAGSGSGTDPIKNNQNTNTNTNTKANTAKKDVISLTLKKVKVKKSAKKLVLQATLKINGKKASKKIIKFKFNKKTYKVKTNAKGIAKLTIKKSVLKKLKAGKKITYQASYGKVTKKVSVKVKK